MSKKVIDVSYAQGKIYFNKVKAAGIDGVIIRCGYGRGNIDEWAQKNIEGAVAAGLDVGVYWFSYAYTTDMARKEARYCNDVCAGWKDKITLGMYFDFEGDSKNWMKKQGIVPTKSLITALNKAFCDEAKALGYDAGYYLNPDYAANWVDEAQLYGYRRWFAWWNNAGKNEKCYMWQYTDKGVIDGVNGNVDMNVLYGEASGGGATPSIADKTTDQLAREVIQGKYGNGKEREKALGDRYDEVQARVNEILGVSNKFYVVKPGDTLWDIAQKFDTTIDKIVALNNIKNPDLIYAGETLRVK